MMKAMMIINVTVGRDRNPRESGDGCGGGGG